MNPSDVDHPLWTRTLVTGGRFKGSFIDEINDLVGLKKIGEESGITATARLALGARIAQLESKENSSPDLFNS